MMMAFALLMIQFVLLMACAQSTHIIAATRDTSCVVSREQLAAAVALVANLEAQLQEARQTVVAKGLEVGSCELGASTTASEHSKTAPRRTNGLDDFSCSSECACTIQCRQCHPPLHTAPGQPDLTKQNCTACYPAPQNLTFAFLARNTREAAMYNATLDEISQDRAILPMTKLLRRIHVLEDTETLAAGESERAYALVFACK